MVSVHQASVGSNEDGSKAGVQSRHPLEEGSKRVWQRLRRGRHTSHELERAVTSRSYSKETLKWEGGTALHKYCAYNEEF